MDLKVLCESIDLPKEVTEQVLKTAPGLTDEKITAQLDRLRNQDTAENAFHTLKGYFDKDDSIEILACYLICACQLYQEYQKRGIPESIFFDTMKCFPRYLKETQQQTGKLVFDRGWWTYRHASMQLFRIGELEYEIFKHENQTDISIHIPSDAHFDPDSITRSISWAKRFWLQFFPEYADCRYVCHSWLLSPELKKLLPENSNILSFQSRFELISVEPERNDYLVWVFHVTDDWKDLHALKEETSLQRSMKKHVLNGGTVGIGFGVLK